MEVVPSSQGAPLLLDCEEKQQSFSAFEVCELNAGALQRDSLIEKTAKDAVALPKGNIHSRKKRQGCAGVRRASASKGLRRETLSWRPNRHLH
jgi:hypothetical protein